MIVSGKNNQGEDKNFNTTISGAKLLELDALTANVQTSTYTDIKIKSLSITKV
jgi:hypothetical protein